MVDTSGSFSGSFSSCTACMLGRLIGAWVFFFLFSIIFIFSIFRGILSGDAPTDVQLGHQEQPRIFQRVCIHCRLQAVNRLLQDFFCKTSLEMKDHLFSARSSSCMGWRPYSTRCQLDFRTYKVSLGFQHRFQLKESEDGKMAVPLRTGEKGALFADLSSSWKLWLFGTMAYRVSSIKRLGFRMARRDPRF